MEGVEVHEEAADDQVDDDHQQRSVCSSSYLSTPFSFHSKFRSFVFRASKETKSAENFIEEMQEIGKLKVRSIQS